MAIRDILLLGNPLLTSVCADVQESERHSVASIGRDLEDTMRAFRARHGWGRAIAAPQIGILKRIVFLDVEGSWLIVNPVITDASREMLELWDNCASFPDLLVRVRRHAAFTLTYRDPEWNERSLRVDGALAELLQHEIDHLDGVLAVSRAVDGAAFSLQSQRHLLPGSAFANRPARG